VCRDLIKLAEYFDNNSEYEHSDLFTRIAVHINHFLTDPQKGLYGEYSDLSSLTPDQKREFKDRTGFQPYQDLGVKKYNPDRDNFYSNIIQENLALKYFAPVINSQTKLIAPKVPLDIGFSFILGNKMNFSSTVPGVHLPNGRSAVSIHVKTEEGIYRKLREVGIIGDDLHANNYKVNKARYDEAFKSLQRSFYLNAKFPLTPAEEKELRILMRDINAEDGLCDLSDGASVFDFGMWGCLAESEPGKNLVALQRSLEKINQQRNNHIIKMIIKSIEEMLID